MSPDVSRVRYISLIRLEGGESVLNIPYAALTVDPDLIAGFVTAVIIFANTPIRTIRKQAYDILIEVGETVLVLLVVDPVTDETPYRVKLKKILHEVEIKHGDRLRQFEGDIRRFREFALSIIREFPFSRPNLDSVPVMKKEGVRIPFRVASVDRELEQVESFINGKRTVAEIMDMMSLDDEDVLALISILARYEWIDFKRRLTEDDILIRSGCQGHTLDLLNFSETEIENLLSCFDGTARIKDISANLGFDKGALWFVINKLVDLDCLRVKLPG